MCRIRRLSSFPVASVLAGFAVLATVTSGYAADPKGEEYLLHPGYDLESLRPPGFEPRVAAMEFIPGNRLAIATWRPNELYVLSGLDGPAKKLKVAKAMGGFKEVMGLCALGDTLFAADQDTLFALSDRDHDGLPDTRRAVGPLPWTGAFHEWSFGLAHANDRFYTGLSVAASQTGKTLAPQKDPRRGSMVAMTREGKLESFASGLRAPDGLCLGPDSGLFATDNQGSWLPASKFIHVQAGRTYGHHIDPAGPFEDAYPAPPAVWLPYGSVSRSPTQPVYLRTGPYAGQFLFGDIAFGVVRRVALEKVDGQWQGCVLHFSGGFEAGVHRMLQGPDGSLYLGGLGNGDSQDWGWNTRTFGLQRIKPNGKPVFEVLAVHAFKGGFEIIFSMPPAQSALQPGSFRVNQWWYEPTQAYGGSPKDVSTVKVESLRASKQATRVFLALEGLRPQQVAHVRMAGMRSQSGTEIWTPDFWYTMNAFADKEFAP